MSRTSYDRTGGGDPGFSGMTGKGGNATCPGASGVTGWELTRSSIAIEAYGSPEDLGGGLRFL